MPVRRAQRQLTAARRLPGAEMSATRSAARRVTTVTSIGRAGIVRQHEQRRLSRANIWEKSMQFEKHLSDDRSFALARYSDKPGGNSVRASNNIITLRSSSEADRSWHAISALMTRAATGLAVCAEFAFPNVLIAVMSWTFAQALAGCAAYAEAMYPGLADAQSGHGNPGQVPSGLPSVAAGESGRAGPISRPSQVAPRALAAEAECTARSDGTGISSASITSAIGRFRSRMRRARERRLAIAELRALDDQSLRDIGISRSEITHVTRRGDRCE
jgi:uncharacterized protein YjiS (DUF1127 family)